MVSVQQLRLGHPTVRLACVLDHIVESNDRQIAEAIDLVEVLSRTVIGDQNVSDIVEGEPEARLFRLRPSLTAR